MPISASQIEKFRESPIPKGVNLEAPEERKILRGNEALVIKIGERALKWYAVLSGRNKDELLKYAQDSDRDEAFLTGHGLKKEQIIDAHYFIASFDSNPELFAEQRWIQGQTAREMTLFGILRNREFRNSLSALLLNFVEIHKSTGRYPDIVGAGRIKIGKMDFFDPRAIIFPWYTTNIINENNEAKIIDTKLIQPTTYSVKHLAMKVNHWANVGFGRLLQLVDKVI